jgi:hypothetical protein
MTERPGKDISWCLEGRLFHGSTGEDRPHGGRPSERETEGTVPRFSEPPASLPAWLLMALQEGVVILPARRSPRAFLLPILHDLGRVDRSQGVGRLEGRTGEHPPSANPAAPPASPPN